MSKGPLFSTYRQGENRVTASMLAVLERIDLALLERLLGAASGESELQMVSFRNQIAGTGSVPDAGISAHFNYLFEVKTTREAVGVRQLRAHLGSLGGEGDQRLFVVTPDIDEPGAVAALRDEDSRVSWIGFAALTDAIGELLVSPDGAVAEREAFLLRELVQLFEADGLLATPEDVVIVPARKAYPSYQNYSQYFCQPGRTFRPGLRYLGFYTSKAIQPEVAAILDHRDHVPISQSSADELAMSEDPSDRNFADVIRYIIDETGNEDWEAQVFLLSDPGDERTILLPRPIQHEGRGAWTQNQRYVSSDILRSEPTTTDELG